MTQGKSKKGWDMPGFDDSHWNEAAIIDQDMSIVVPQDGVFVTRQETLKPITMFKTPKDELVIDFLTKYGRLGKV